MCGRFTLMTDKEYADLERIVREVENDKGVQLSRGGDIYPTNASPVLINRQGRRLADLFQWGFPNFYNKGVIINARAETVPEKKTFRSCLDERRCVVPAAGFYEWDRQKQKILFFQPHHALYMAGLYQYYNDQPRYVVITTSANTSVSDIHDRMPLILQTDQIDPWLEDTGAAMSLLHIVPPALERLAV